MDYRCIPDWVACNCSSQKHHKGLESLYINENYYSYPEASAVISQCLSFTLSPACTNFFFLQPSLSDTRETFLDLPIRSSTWQPLG